MESTLQDLWLGKGQKEQKKKGAKKGAELHMNTRSYTRHQHDARVAENEEEEGVADYEPRGIKGGTERK